MTDALSEKLKSVGLVNGAVFSDLTGDGLAELILACEWGPIRVFEFKAGKLNELTPSLGLAAHTGWWWSICAQSCAAACSVGSSRNRSYGELSNPRWTTCLSLSRYSGQW